MKDGFLRVAAVTPDIKVADCDHNADEIIKYAKEAARNDASVIVFPELCITGSTCGDLFLQKTLLDGAKKAVKESYMTEHLNSTIFLETELSELLAFI